MYRINDRSEAIRTVQRYLRVVGNSEIFVAPTGVFDENTSLSVIDFQSRNQLEPTGVVDRETFELLYSQYVNISNRKALNDKLDSFIRFPLLPGDMNDAMIHINRTLRRLLDYYGFTHRLRDSNFYSAETGNAVDILRKIFLLKTGNLIDEGFYLRMLKDHDSIGLFNNNFP